MDAAQTSPPSKRRALAPLDANTLPSPKVAAAVKNVETSPLRKRAVEAAATVAVASPRPAKKTCVEQHQSSSQESTRPDTPSNDEDEDESSMFDNNDASWATNTTPDVSPAPRTLTREQAREKAETLRLRLGLASYKLRTGQISVPLADLVAKPLPAPLRWRAATPVPPRDAGEREDGEGAASGLLSLARAVSAE